MGEPQDAAIVTDEENEAPRRILTRGPGFFPQAEGHFGEVGDEVLIVSTF